MTNRTDLSDTTFVIPIRIDSNERKENLEMVTDFLYSEFQTNIIVVESDKSEKLSESTKYDKFFFKDDLPYFYRTQILNRVSKNVETKNMAIWDSDVLIEKWQVIRAVNELRSYNTDMIFPYDGRFYNIPGIIKKVYKEVGNLSALTENIGKLSLIYGYNSVGGAFIVNTESYKRAGLENENFVGWGPEDKERVKRWEILGFKVERTDGALFHLWHPNSGTGWFYSKDYEKNAWQEYLKVCSMTNEELIEYVKSF